ncbi:pyrokinin-1 receptor-like isoform X1 [Neodiprion virginianus]|uniref:pyrokinin-1 receptor-like isoform X1 n=2 Tax=Neodiprion virginianus TaxID=2961670 RepID=UPI001EE6A8F7|nr:pyrokinin-1 receptor-like isoform X1 [Neodiprion virginianus]
MAWNNSGANLTGLFSPLDNHSAWSKDGGDEAYQMLGPRRDALYVVVPITVMYASIFLTGIIGNVSTCIVIARNKSMHTATNYYLFSLAVSDLLLLVSGLPPEIYLVWSKYPYVFGEGFCVLRGLAAETSTNATVLTITAFTVERYVAICHPFLSHTMSKLSRAIRLILVIWLVALCFAVPQALQFGIVVHPDKASDIVMCTYKTVILEHSFELSTFLFFLVPMTLITVLYALIGLKLRKSNMMKRVSGSGPNGRKGAVVTLRKDSRNCRHSTGRSSHRVLKMLVAVVVAFFICWAPFHVQRLIAIYGTNTVDHISSNSPWMAFLYLLFTYISGVLYYFSTTVNPILYNIMSNKFREAFMETLSRCCRIGGYKGRRSQRRSYSTLSRSQQRANGVFGCRNGGPHGAQESTDCSGNSQSIRDDSLQQSVSGGGGCNAISKNPSCDSRLPMSGKRSSSRRTLSTEIGSSEANPSGVKLSGQSQRGRWSQARKSSPRREGSPHSPEGAAKVRGTAIVYYRRSGRPRNRRWWDIFKWLSGRKPVAGRGASYSPPGPLENVIIDVQINPEEYSMTPCNISNTSLRDVDHRAMDEELSAYMEEIRRRELQGEIRASGNG